MPGRTDALVAAVTLALGCNLIGGLEGYDIAPPQGSAATGAGGAIGSAAGSGAAGVTASSSSGTTCDLTCGGPCLKPPSCQGSKCVANPVDQGSKCGDGLPVCDGNGHCVGCVNASNCGTHEACQKNNCVSGCTDGIADFFESGIDCGGSECPKCPNGQACFGPGDCMSGLCKNTCVACSAQTPCGAGSYCQNGTCLLKKSLGIACGNKYECQSDCCMVVCAPASFCVGSSGNSGSGSQG